MIQDLVWCNAVSNTRWEVFKQKKNYRTYVILTATFDTLERPNSYIQKRSILRDFYQKQHGYIFLFLGKRTVDEGFISLFLERK